MFAMSIKEARQYKPCAEGWYALLRGLNKSGDDEEIVSLLDAFRVVGLENAVWALKDIPAFKVEQRIYNVLCAEHVPLNVRNELFERVCKGELRVADIEQYETPPPSFIPPEGDE